jgi:glycine/D-amino acid oxidase-like deaminating enzyme
MHLRLAGPNGSPNRSLWLEQALAVERPSPPDVLRERRTCDVCIVGGGYTGMWTAWRILEHEPSASIVILEADVCGGGASGRNTGQALSLWTKIETLTKGFGTDEGVRMAHASADAIGDIGAFCEEHGIDAEFRRSGWMILASSRAQLDGWAGFVAACERVGAAPFDPLTREEIERRTGSQAFHGGVFDAQAAIVQPALLARGMRRVLAARGVTIHEGTPVTGIDGATGAVSTPFGSVRASEAVVLALGGWSASLGPLRRAVVAVSSDVVATEPIAERLDRSGWTGGEALTTSRMTLRYTRRSSDGRVMFGRAGAHLGVGGRITRRFDADPAGRQWAGEEIGKYVPAARGARITHVWSGPVDRSVDGLPFFGVLGSSSPRVVYGAGFSGNGVAPSVMGGRILASLALGRRDEWSECGLVRPTGGHFPVEPLRSVGGIVVKAAMHRMEDRQEQDRPVGRLTRAIAAQAPKGLVNVQHKEAGQ